jgi:hypothetical protein
MSKSYKKQRERERARQGAVEGSAEMPGQTPQAPLGLEIKGKPLKIALYESIVSTLKRVGEQQAEGDRNAWIYNGEALAMKHLEPDSLLVAAFKQGVVFQSQGDRQIIYKPGAWEAVLGEL